MTRSAIRHRSREPRDGHLGPLTTLARDGSILRPALRDAIERGELPPATEVDLLHDVLLGAMRYLLEVSSTPCDSMRLERAVTLILKGAGGLRQVRRKSR